MVSEEENVKEAAGSFCKIVMVQKKTTERDQERKARSGEAEKGGM